MFHSYYGAPKYVFDSRLNPNRTCAYYWHMYLLLIVLLYVVLRSQFCLRRPASLGTFYEPYELRWPGKMATRPSDNSSLFLQMRTSWNETEIQNTNMTRRLVSSPCMCTYYGASLSDFMMKWDEPVDFQIDCLRSVGEDPTQDNTTTPSDKGYEHSFM